MLKIVFISLSLFIFSGAIAIALWVLSSPFLSEESDAVILKVGNSPLPELMIGHSGYALSKDLKIWYEVRNPAPEVYSNPVGTVLLINGLGSTGLLWPKAVYQPLLAAGFQVIVTDHRGVGLSSAVTGWSKKTAYTLSDMMQDNLAVLNALNIESVHVLGVSLGGMIAQQMAIDTPERVKTLTSVMSTGFFEDPDLPSADGLNLNILRVILRYGFPRNEVNKVKMIVGILELMKGNKALDIEFLAQYAFYELRKRKGFNDDIPNQQKAAMVQSGSRYEGLKSMTLPMLVIHGESDPLLNIAHGKKYASLVPNAQTLWVKGMGHDYSPYYTKIWMERVITFLEQ